MSEPTILLADNDLDFLRINQEFLESIGYRVFLAADVVEARRVLQQKPVDLAILDLRLSNDDDAKDRSGLLLSQEVAYRSVPKMILTRFPGYQATRDALRPVPAELPPSIDFLDKTEGLEGMLWAVEQAFAKHVRINYKLKLIFTEPQSFASMAKQILGGRLSEEELNDRAMELEKLLRHLFYENTEVFLDPSTVHWPGQVVAHVRAIRGMEEGPQYLLKCARLEVTRLEKVAYDKRYILVQKRALRREDLAASVHFGAILYAAPTDLQLESAQWLAEYYHWHTADEVCHALEDLFGKAYDYLYTQPCPAEENRSLSLLYKEHLSLASAHHPKAAFKKAMQELAEYTQLQHLATVHVESETQTIAFLFPDGNEVSYPDPTSYIYEDTMLLGPPVLCRLVLGNMNGDNVLVDQEGRVWVTDFATIGPAPTLTDFVALETRIRFEWIDTADLNRLRDFEAHLTAIRPLDEPLCAKDVEAADLKKALQVITRVRQLAARVQAADELEYHFGILFHAARIIVADAPPDRKIHALLAAAMICQELSTREV